MRSIWAIVPLKPLDQAKTRLAAVLSRSECRELSLHMAEDVIGALTGAGCFKDVGILTCDPALSTLADRFDCRILHEEPSRDWQQNLALAACDLAAVGTETLVVVPGDLPALTPPDVDLLLARHTVDVTVVPAGRDGGTNAIVLTPPDAIGFLFGPDSARRHVEEAARHRYKAAIVPVEAFALDIDTPQDLGDLCQSTRTSATRIYLDRSGIAARLRENPGTAA
jgi:2-phospho-L-lactate/phosphoenolpyruvate guanylyltransferase